MEQILLAYSFPKEMMLYKNMIVKVCSLDGDTDFFDIVAGVLQGDTLALYLFIICLDDVLQTLIDLMKGKKQMIPCTNDMYVCAYISI